MREGAAVPGSVGCGLGSGRGRGARRIAPGTLSHLAGPAVRQELDLIARAIEGSFPEAEDRVRAQVADLQGIGASRDAAHRRPVPPAGRS